MTPALGPQGLRNLGQGAEVDRLSEPGSPFQCSLSFVPHSEELHSAPWKPWLMGRWEVSPAPPPYVQTLAAPTHCRTPIGVIYFLVGHDYHTHFT